MRIRDFWNQRDNIRGETQGDSITFVKIIKKEQDFLLKKPPKLLKEVNRDHRPHFFFQEPTFQPRTLIIIQENKRKPIQLRPFPRHFLEMIFEIINHLRSHDIRIRQPRPPLLKGYNRI
jgi:hypothetical protein